MKPHAWIDRPTPPPTKAVIRTESRYISVEPTPEGQMLLTYQEKREGCAADFGSAAAIPPHVLLEWAKAVVEMLEA